MRIAALIAATLSIASCSDGTDGCPPPVEDEAFSLNVDVDERAVQDLLSGPTASDRTMLSCDYMCALMYDREETDRTIKEIRSCTLEIDAVMAEDPAQVVGSLQCEGDASGSLCIGGRRPLGHIEQAPPDGRLPAFLAHGAHLEAASVVAFTQLAERLRVWGAPAELVARCRRAAREEAVHAALLGALAREAGAEVEPASQRPVAVDLACAALDNAVEGCVLEAWSALACAATARWGAPALRATYARLAADEAGHAQLAWDLHTWFMGQVGVDDRARIVAAQQAALAGLPALARAQARRTPPALAPRDADTARRFAAGLAQAA